MKSSFINSRLIMRKMLTKKFIPLVNIFIFAIIHVGCTVQTLPNHDPIYPGSGENVIYTLDVQSSSGIENIKLYELISSVNSSGIVTPGTEVLLQEWSPPGSPNSTTVTFTKIGGYSTNKLIRYRFVAKNGRGRTRSHHVMYAIRPYPITDQPAPVYNQGSIDRVFDVIFIPDTDITNMTTFRNHCRQMILNSIFAENTVKNWTKHFNFYINPNTGTATDYDRISIDGTHQTPTNWANLSFAEAKVMMHQNNLRDYASGGLFSTEQQNRGTMMHEGGHAMFGCADEYSGGTHWQAATLPNNWSTLTSAQADAPSRHKTASDVQQMGTSGWYKICDNNCQMKKSGLTLSHYDKPCSDRVIYSIIDNAINP